MSEIARTAYPHVNTDDSGTPIIEGTRMKVSQLVSEHLVYGWSPDELCFQHPHLSLGQVHSALAYYWDHREQIDKEIEATLEYADALQRAAPPSRLRDRLQAKGLIQTWS